MLDYEKKSHRPASRSEFRRRLAIHLLSALGVVVFAIVSGMSGYMYFAKLSVVDAFLNAAMIFSGMGPVDTLPNDSAKIFSGIYGLTHAPNARHQTHTKSFIQSHR